MIIEGLETTQEVSETSIATNEGNVVVLQENQKTTLSMKYRSYWKWIHSHFPKKENCHDGTFNDMMKRKSKVYMW